MRQNQYGEWEVVPPGDPEYDRDRFGWHLDPLEIDELLVREKRDLMAEHLYADIELKITNGDGDIRVLTGRGDVRDYHGDYGREETIIDWLVSSAVVTPAPLKEPIEIGTRIELNNSSKWVLTNRSQSPWLCYSHQTPSGNVGATHSWSGLNQPSTNPKLVTN